MSTLRVVVVAADPLLRKAVSESLNELKTLGEVTAITPTRATPDRMSATDAVLIAGTDADARTLKPAVAAALGAGRPVVFVIVGEGGAPALLALGTPGAFSVKVPDLDIRAQLASAAPKIADLLRRADAAQVPAAEAEPASAPVRTPAAPRPVAPGAPYLGVVICIGASTGGTDALLAILSRTPRTSPPIVIVQHMPEAYVGDFAARLGPLVADGRVAGPGRPAPADGAGGRGTRRPAAAAAQGHAGDLDPFRASQAGSAAIARRWMC